MVDYRQWVSIAFEVSKAKGLNTSNPANNSDVMSVAGSIWKDRKEELKRADEETAKQIAKNEITVNP